MKNFIHILSCSALLLLIVACSGNGNDAEATKEKRAMLRADSIAYKVAVTPSAEALPIYVAEHLGLLDSVHTNVRIKRYHALSECRIALQHNMVEAAIIDSILVKVINDDMRSNGKASTAAGDKEFLSSTVIGISKYHLLTSRKARIHRISQLPDKVIAADSHGFTHEAARMATDSLTKRKHNVFIVQAEDLRVRSQMLMTGNVDGAILPEPFASQAIQKGAYSIKLAPQILTTQTILAYRSATTKSPSRRKQQDNLLKALSIANDSIKQYGAQNYFYLLK